jgi:uncharacterized protein (DUF58 family)
VRFQPSQWSVIAAALFLLVVGLMLGNLLLVTGAVFVLVTAFVSTTLAPPHDVNLTRSLDKTTCWIGETLTVERRLTAGGGVGTLFVHDELPPEANVVDGNNLRVVWKWSGRQAVDLSYQVRFPKRGTYTLEATGWESWAPFGTGRRAAGASGGSIQVSVVPRIRSIASLNLLRLPAASGRYTESLGRVGATSDEFRELRPYQTGDPFNRINWKASARGRHADSRPMVNDMYPQAMTGVWVFLDTADYMDIGQSLANPLEHSIEAAGALAQFYLVRGSSLGAYPYNNSDRNGLLTPDSGRSQLRRLLQLLVGLKPGPPREDLLQATERCKSFLIRLHPNVYVITRLDVQYDRPGDPAGSLNRFKSAITRLASFGATSTRKNRVSVVHVAQRVSSEASRGADWAGWESQVVAREVRGAGARVIEWEPGREEFAAVLLRHAKTDL